MKNRYLNTKKGSLLLVLFIILTVILSYKCSKEKPKDSLNEIVPLDGRGGGILAYSVTNTTGTNQLFLVNADGTGSKQLPSISGRPLSPAWSPNADKIAFYNHISEQKWSIYTMNSDGSNAIPLTNEPNTLDWCPAWSPDGSQILFTRSFATPSWRSEIWVMQSDGTNSRKVTSVDGQGADWSPDGTKIIYFNYVDGGGDIWLMNSDGTNSTKLTNHTAEDWWPQWSPDGSKIAFQSKRDGNFEIYLMNADGSNLVRLTSNLADDEEPRWSPDGTKTAFSSLRDGHYEIYVMNADGTNQKRITNVNGQAINPDWKTK